jgi:putative membrane protein
MTTAAMQKSSTRTAILTILAVSVAASLFILWLVYIHPAAAASGKFAFLPGLNAFFNGLSATALLIGFTLVKARRIAAHRTAMISAFAFSTLFLVGYLFHHYLHAEVKYPAGGSLRPVYIPLLISHIVLAAVALPLILVTFFFSLSGRIPQHRKIARWTFPIWLYVGVTGVVTFVMLRLAQG